MDISILMALIFFLALWGAILSSVLAILEINKSRMDKPSVVVSLHGGDKVIPANHPANPYGDAPVLSINATNKGKKPAYLIQAGFLRPRGKGSFVLVDSESTIRINEGQSHMYRIREDEVGKKASLGINMWPMFWLQMGRSIIRIIF
jgi:hypothetical protein